MQTKLRNWIFFIELILGKNRKYLSIDRWREYTAGTTRTLDEVLPE